MSDTMPVSVAVNGLSHYRDRYNPTGPSNPPHFAQLRVQNRHDRLKGWRLGMHILRFSKLPLLRFFLMRSCRLYLKTIGVLEVIDWFARCSRHLP